MRDVESCFDAPVSERAGGIAERDDLGVCRGIVVDFAAITTAESAANAQTVENIAANAVNAPSVQLRAESRDSALVRKIQDLKENLEINKKSET